jgi:S-DNA-T family DNA segregation ATPase FtsK/SpoIIIE
MVRKNSKWKSSVKRTAVSRNSSRKRKNSTGYTGRRVEVFGILILMAAILLTISVFIPQDSGFINQRVNEFFSYIFGIGKYIIPFLLLVWGVSFFIKKIKLLSVRFGFGFLLLFISSMGIISSNLKYTNIFDSVLIKARGGITGAGVFYGLFKLFGRAGAITVLSVLIIISIIIITRISLTDAGRKIGSFFQNIDFKIFSEVFRKEKPLEKEKNREMFRAVPVKKEKDYGEGKNTVISGQNKKGFVSEPELIDNLSRDAMEKQFKNESNSIKSEQ